MSFISRWGVHEVRGVLEEIATTSGSTSSSTSSSTSTASPSNHSGSPSNVEQMLKNDTASPTVEAIKEKTTPNLDGPEIQRKGDKSSGFADFNFRPPSDTPKQTPNDVLGDSKFLDRIVNKG